MTLRNDHLKRLRTSLGLTQEALAKQAGLTYHTIVKIESGANKNPTIRTLKKLSDSLGISVDDLITS